METTPFERSKRLHNFSLPCLKWGNQRFLKCVKLDNDDDPQSSSFPNTPIHRSNNPTIEDKPEDDSQSTRPWNLRTRRAACNAPDNERKFVELPKSKGNKVKEQSLEVKERVKFSVSLSKEEIREDFAEMVGIRPPRRPKKRARIVQKQLDSIFPGLWLTEVTPDAYKVPDVAE